MADVNWLLEDTSETYSSAASSGNDGETGSPSNIGDQNENTSCYWQHSCGVGQCPVVGAGTVIEVTFSGSYSVNKMEMVFKTITDVGGAINCNWKMEYYNGSWIEVDSHNQASDYSKQKVTKSFSQVDNVTKVRATVVSTGATEWNGGVAKAYIYELYVWGPSYIDIGFRIRTSGGTINIGVKDLEGTHKLRIRKGGTTYGIPLLATSDPAASGIRIYDGSAIKALPKVT
jgi:hypothetical protein